MLAGRYYQQVIKEVKMAHFQKKKPELQQPMDLDSVMKKYDRESNTRIW